MKTIYTPFIDKQIITDPLLMHKASNLLNQQLDIDIKHYKFLNNQQLKNNQLYRSFQKGSWFYKIDKKRIEREIRGIKKRYPNIDELICNFIPFQIEQVVDEKLDSLVQLEPEQFTTTAYSNTTNIIKIAKSKLSKKYLSLDYNGKVAKFKSALKILDNVAMQDLAKAIYVLHYDRINEFIESITNEDTDHGESKVTALINSISFAYEFKQELDKQLIITANEVVKISNSSTEISNESDLKNPISSEKIHAGTKGNTLKRNNPKYRKHLNIDPVKPKRIKVTTYIPENDTEIIRIEKLNSFINNILKRKRLSKIEKNKIRDGTHV